MLLRATQRCNTRLRSPAVAGIVWINDCQRIQASRCRFPAASSPGCGSPHAARVAKELFVDIEVLRAQAHSLELELQQASRTAEVSAKRSRRLANRSQELQAYALEHVMLGDEAAARAALLQKASVADALAAATRRAETNSALARRLEDVLTSKQSQLLVLIRMAKVQTDAEMNTAATAPTASVQSDLTVTDATTDISTGRGLKRSRSVGWASPSLHASSEFDEQLQQQRDEVASVQMEAGGSPADCTLESPVTAASDTSWHGSSNEEVAITIQFDQEGQRGAAVPSQAASEYIGKQQAANCKKT